MKKYISFFLITGYLLHTAHLCFSQWNINPAVNTPLSIKPNDQQSSDIASDEKGGAIIVWEDFRVNDSIADIYVQRVDRNGYVMWTVDGVNICAHDSDQGTVEIIADGSGGAIFSWNDHRSGDRDIYAQRVDSSGNVLWAPNGVPVSPPGKMFDQRDSKLTSDGHGGAIIVWQDSAILSKWDIYAQRIDSAGNQVWASVGIPVTDDPKTQLRPKIRADGVGGAFIVWQDKILGKYNIFAKRVNSSGTTVWGGQYGDPVCAAVRGQSYPIMKSDGAGGMIIAWLDKRNLPVGIDSVYDVFAQRVNSAGTMLWQNDGVPVSVSDSSQENIDMTTDGVNGTIFVWKDNRNGNWDIYAQLIDPAGNPRWTTNGIPVNPTSFKQSDPSIIGDRKGGSIIAYKDSSSGNNDIYSVRIDSTGNILWTSPVATADSSQSEPRTVSDGIGGCIYSFEDKRSGAWDMYAHHLYWNGTNDAIPESMAFFQSSCFPNPFSFSANIEFFAPHPENVHFSVFNLFGTKIDIPFAISRNRITLWKGNTTNGIYFYEIRTKHNGISKGKLILTD